jgi:hypothetical protein
MRLQNKPFIAYIATFQGEPIQGVFAETDFVAWKQLLACLECDQYTARKRGYRVRVIQYDLAGVTIQ